MRRLLCSVALLLVLELLPALAGAVSVRLEWDYTQDPQAEAVGFHVYRQEACQGAFGKVTTQLLPRTPLAFLDQEVRVGKTYCWYVTAHDALGTESAPSNTVQFRVSQPSAPHTLRGRVVP